jgi:acyl carrier protein
MQNIEKLQHLLKNEPYFIEQKITSETSLSTLAGWDSFKHISFMMQLEMEFDIDIEVEDGAEMDLVANILKKLP